MACMNEILSFGHPHFATPAAANFGYADVTAAAGHHRDHSHPHQHHNHHHRPSLPPSPPSSVSPRFQSGSGPKQPPSSQQQQHQQQQRRRRSVPSPPSSSDALPGCPLFEDPTDHPRASSSSLLQGSPGKTSLSSSVCLGKLSSLSPPQTGNPPRPEDSHEGVQEPLHARPDPSVEEGSSASSASRAGEHRLKDIAEEEDEGEEEREKGEREEEERSSREDAAGEERRHRPSATENQTNTTTTTTTTKGGGLSEGQLVAVRRRKKKKNRSPVTGEGEGQGSAGGTPEEQQQQQQQQQQGQDQQQEECSGGGRGGVLTEGVSSERATMEEEGSSGRESRSPRSSTGSSSDSMQILSLREHYEVERELGRGTYGKVVLARCRHTGTHVALKLLPKTSTKLRDFQREFQLSYFLSPHCNIIDTYNVAFQTKSSFVFAQEHAALGDLFDAIPPQLGMREADAKAVVKQLASALEFMHSKHLVHRDIKPENVLVMSVDFSRVKLMDFGMTRKHGTMVRKTNGSIPYTPPEVCEAVRNESILVSASADVWALAVLLFCMLTGNFPWENADIGDMYFKEFVLWQRRKTTKLPSQWRRFSPRAMKFFRKALDVKPERRCNVGEIHKYLGDAWTQKPRTNDSEEESGSSASCDHMDELATMLKDHGIETRVDRRLRERRISEWLLSL